MEIEVIIKEVKINCVKSNHIYVESLKNCFLKKNYDVMDASVNGSLKGHLFTTKRICYHQL